MGIFSSGKEVTNSDTPKETGNTSLQTSVYDETEGIDTSKSAPANRSSLGPLDQNEVAKVRPYLDFGSIKINPREGLGIRIDVDESNQQIIAVSLDYKESTLQLQAYASPKTTGMWNLTRHAIQKELANSSVNIREEEGEFGPELWITPQAGQDAAPIRLIGVDGPRWMLRGGIVGRALTNKEIAAEIEELFRETVVVRGDVPMPPGALLPLQMNTAANSAAHPEHTAGEEHETH